MTRIPRECAKVVRCLDELCEADDQASAGHERLLAHARICQRCALELERAREARLALAGLPRVVATDGLLTRIRHAVALERTAEASSRALGSLPRVVASKPIARAVRERIASDVARRQAALCASFASRVDRLLDGELEAGLTLAMERHAARCETCAATLERARRSRALLRGSARPAGSRALTRIRELVGQRRIRESRPSAAPAWIVAAAAVGCIALVVAIRLPRGAVPASRGLGGETAAVEALAETETPVPTVREVEVVAAPPAAQPGRSIAAAPRTLRRPAAVSRPRAVRTEPLPPRGESGRLSEPAVAADHGPPDSLVPEPERGQTVLVVASPSPPATTTPNDSGLPVAAIPTTVALTSAATLEL